jgi:hypothetical protein
MQITRWAGGIFSVSVTISCLVIPMMFPSINPVLGWILLAVCGFSAILAAVLWLFPWSLNICRRLSLWISMHKQDESWISLSLASKWLSLNAGPLLKKKLSEIAPMRAEDYCAALLISQINAGSARARGIRCGGTETQDIPRHEGFKRNHSEADNLVVDRYGVIEPAFYQVTVRREQLNEIKKIAEDIHSYYESRPVPAIEVVDCFGSRFSNITVSGSSGFAARNSTDISLTNAIANGTQDKGGVGFEFDNSPGAKLRDVESNNFEKGYRFKDSPDADLRRVRADGKNPNEDVGDI